MCASIGVDPLSSGKGFWSVLGIGDFYYELAVQIVEVCLGKTFTVPLFFNSTKINYSN